MKNYPTQALFISLLVLLASACQSSKKQDNEKMQTNKQEGIFEVMEAGFFDVVSKTATLDTLSDGYRWTEGPVWVPELNALLFSDVPQNTVFKWTEKDGASEYLKPSGHTGNTEGYREPGSNGLTLNSAGELVLCQHGDRRIAKMSAAVENPGAEFVTIADRFEGKRFNSPNDLCYDSKGNLYFTDPPYGLPKQVDDPEKEIPFQGVYLVRPSGEVILLVDSLTRPNGIALTPDEKQIIVANSDEEKAQWYIYDVKEDGTLENGRLYYDATSYVPDHKGLPDGLKIDRSGNVFATGPGGVWVFDSMGKALGIIKTGQATANCAFGDNESILYITAHSFLMRMQLR